ncbi:MAG: hypothetical protein HS111_18130 [Kofleriaceae bacterium]|nr:hypothetical protein [Kofleriaceae bacterium]
MPARHRAAGDTIGRGRAVPPRSPSLLVLAPACGRVGYDALADRDAGDDPIDAPIDAEVGVLAT